jgi:hypothetical protein
MQPPLANVFQPLINVFEAILKVFHDDIWLPRADRASDRSGTAEGSQAEDD